MRCSLLLIFAIGAASLFQDHHFGQGFHGEYRNAPRYDRNEHKPRSSRKFSSPETDRFAVNSSNIPEVDFDVGEFYAGLLPIEGKNDTNQLYFWFNPTSAAEDPKEILIYLSGGPGCSSTGESMTENGPISWKAGTHSPVPNEWSWHHLTNVIWVDQPIGTGFSQGTVTARNTVDVAQQFMGFWKNFVHTFSLQGYKIYITGSSYSGQWSPYLASEMLDAEDTEYFDVAGMMVYDGLYSQIALHHNIPLYRFTEKWNHILNLNDTIMSQIRGIAEECELNAYVEKYLTFPPVGEQPSDLPGPFPSDGTYIEECDVPMFYAAMQEINPCYSLYNIREKCPMVWDINGFGTGRSYVAPGPVFFNRTDVKEAINAPVDTDWLICVRPFRPVFVDDINTLFNPGPGSMPVLPGVIDRTENVILGHGLLDHLTSSEGTLLAIQNLTFGGQLGFQSTPETPLYVPLRAGVDEFEVPAASGTLGTWHKERGLTYFESEVSGHYVAKDTPSLAFRAIEILLGRISDFGSEDSFTVG